ncbi:MAG: S9 family peptidase [Blastocatellia bacterium]|nr:S9 family peptidase [Blastocatellia bacterium]MCS7156579.1 S9 family peptidase [Blastocatellia bacterium]MCX7751680.1 S9 family peptidase [Blastocatellia bacterium]
MRRAYRGGSAVLLSFLLWLNGWGAWAVELPPLIPREVLFGNPEKASPQISPDGTKLAYLAPHNGVLNVWVRTIGKQDDQVVTSDKKRGIRAYVWQGDSEHILYIQDRDGDENWHLYQTNLKTKTTRDLTPFEGVQARIVATDPQFPDEILVGLNLRDRRWHDVYRINLKTGAVELDTENPGDVMGWAADHRLQVRAAAAFTPDGGMLIRVREDARSPWRELLRWGPDETMGQIAGFTPDGRGLWLASSVGANAARLIEVDIATGKMTVIAEDPQYDVSEWLVHPKTRRLEAVQFIRARREWQLLDPSLRADFDLLRKERDGDLSIISRDREDRMWIVAYLMDDGPVYYYAYDRSARRLSMLFSNRPALEQYRLAKMQPISFTARDGMTIYGYLTLPVGVPPKNLPMVLLVHGGPWARDVWGFDPIVQWLANRGYAVLQVNFRGSTGYGKAYLNAGDREWAGKMHTDLIDGKNWAVQQGYADPKRVCIMGGSYGGYATLVGLTFTPEEFACGVDIVGPSNLVTLLRSIPPYWAPIKALFDKRLGKVETDEEFLKSRSPLFRADQIKAPLLIAHGANDPRVKKAESDQIVQTLRAKNIPVTYVVYPDEGHGFARPENRLDFFGRAEEFLAKHLGGRFEPWREVPGSSAQLH